MKKIIVLCRRYCPGEAWTNRILSYAKYLSVSEAETIMMFLISDRDRKEVIRTIPNSDTRVINLWENDSQFFLHFRILAYLKNLIKACNYIHRRDVVLIYGAELPLLVAALFKGASVYTEITEHPFKDKDNSDEQRLPLLKRTIYNKLSGLFVISSTLRSYFIKQGISDDKIKIVNMFVDSCRFSRVKDDESKHYIGYCGTLSYHKDGVDNLVRAFASFHKTHQNYHLLLIGRAESQDVMTRLKMLVEELNLQKAVHFTGKVSAEEIPSLLKGATVLALARPDNTQARNGFPTKLGEYLATGKPVLVTSVGEIPRFLIDGYNAYMVEPGNTEAFAQKMSYIVDNLEVAQVVARRGEELTKSEFDAKTQVEGALSFILNSK